MWKSPAQIPEIIPQIFEVEEPSSPLLFDNYVIHSIQAHNFSTLPSTYLHNI